MPFRAHRGLLLAACLALATGCGDDAEVSNGYIGEVNATYGRLAQTFTDLQRKVTPVSSPESDSKAIAEYRAAADRTVKSLQAIKPPEAVTDLHEQLTNEIAAYRAQFDKAAGAFASKDNRRVLEAQTELTTATTAIGGRINETIAKINAELR